MTIAIDYATVVPDFSGLSVEEVEAEFFTLSGHLAAGECRQLLLLGELSERGSWHADGYRSLPQWLSARAGIDPGTAAARLRVAVRLRRLPLVTAAFACGRLSYSQVRAISRALCSGADPALEGDMVELAGSLTAAQLETACRVMAGLTDDQAADAEDRVGLRCRDIGPGLSEIRVLVPTVERERVTAAIDRRLQAEPPPPEGVPLEGLDRRRALALVDLTVMAAGEPQDRPAVNIIIGLADYEARQAGSLGDRLVAAGIIDRCLCEGDTRAVVVNEHGQPVMAGSKRRFGTIRQRRAATARDRGRCQCCGSRWRTQLHHVNHWEKAKTTAVDRLVTLCRACHTAHHLGSFTIHVDAATGGFVFTTPTGEPFHRPPRQIHGSHPGLVDANAAAGVTAIEAVSQSRWDGEPLDTYWLPGRHTPDNGEGRDVPRDAPAWGGTNPWDVSDSDIRYDTASPDTADETDTADVPWDASPDDVPRDVPLAAPPGPFHTAELLKALRDHARGELGWSDEDLTIYANAIASLPDSPDHHVPRDVSDAAAPTVGPLRQASWRPARRRPTRLARARPRHRLRDGASTRSARSRRPAGRVPCQRGERQDVRVKVMRRVVVFDAADLDAESAFWAGMLEGRVVREDRWHSVIDGDGHWVMAVQLAPNHVPPGWPDGNAQQVHLDLHVDDAAGAHATAIALGARLLYEAADLASPEGHEVFADPAGHPFCIGWGHPDDDAVRRYLRDLP